MKKFIAIFILSMIVISASAQIQRKFFGLSLGVSTRNQVANVIKKKKLQIVVDDEDGLAVTNLQFGGYNWYFIRFTFVNNKLSGVYFSDDDSHTERRTLDIFWNHYVDKLYEKYLNYYINDTDVNEELHFEDKKTMLLLQYNYFKGVKFLSLAYRDVLLMESLKRNDIDEL